MASGMDELTVPSYLAAMDWNNSHHRRSIAACLVQGAYSIEHDRRENRLGPQALAPQWWEFLNFNLVQVLVDENDISYFGAIFEYKFPLSPHSPSIQTPPQYVIAFRGTINKSGNRAQDFKLDLHCVLNDLGSSTRFRVGIESTRDIVTRVGQRRVWMAGHSLGSSIALLIGKAIAKTMNIHLETYLFNPPFMSPPIESIKNETLKLGLRFANSILTAGLAAVTHGGGNHKDYENDPFLILSTWVPYLFLNPHDPICNEYCGYFDHREKMDSIGAGRIGRLATQHSIGSMISGVGGKDPEALHLIPSAYLTINSSPCPNFKEAHGIHQWWRMDWEFKYKYYIYQ